MRINTNEMKIILLILFVIINIISCNESERDNYIGMDYRIFKNSPIYELAKAVKFEDLSKIEKLVVDKKYDINYQDEKYGNTLLILSIWNHDYKSFRKLIELGADVKIKTRIRGTSAIIEVCLADNIKERKKIIRLLIEKGADLNDIDTTSNWAEYTGYSPIMALCCGLNEDTQQEKIKNIGLLLEKGANINLKNKRKETALTISLLSENYEVTLYLLKKGADPYILAVDNSDIQNGNTKTIIELLNEKEYPQKSGEYYKKIQIIDFLNSKGIFK